MRISYIMPQVDYATTGMYVFSKKINLENTETYKINIYTTGRYILTINGKYICEGPCKSHEYVRYYDSIETDAFSVGENEITVTVMHVADNLNFTSVFQTLYPQLVFEAKSYTNLIVSDTSWKCEKDERIDFLYREIWRFIAPYEKVDYNKGFKSFNVCENGGFDFEKGLEAPYGITNGQALEPRPIPMLTPAAKKDFTIVKKGRNFIELDAGEYTTSKVYFNLNAKSKVKIIYSECYEFEDGKKLRDDVSGTLNGYFDIVNTCDATVYSPFWFRAFRFIRIEADDIDSAFLGATHKPWHYPVVFDGSFNCSDEYFNKMQHISINTMLCCTHETFYDCPYYEQQQYVMDATIESNLLMRMTGDTRLIRKTIEEFAASQQDDGLILANYPAIYKQIIPGFSFFFIYLLNDYLEYTKDTEFVARFVSTADKIFYYFTTALSGDGLICKSKYWDFVDWVPEWNDGEPNVREGEPLTVYNMYYAYALLCAENICKKVGRLGLASEYNSRYNDLKAAIKTHCFDKKRGLYCDSFVGSDYSMHTIIWAIIAKLETGDNAKNIAEHLWDTDVKKTTFSMNYYLFRALEKCGLTNKIFQNLDGWHSMMDMHCTSWCENPDNPRSECHAWSSAPLYEFSANILGVKVGFEDEIVIKPTTASLNFACGKVPTRFGVVEISWEKADGVFKIEITAPERLPKKLILPNGTIKEFEENITHIIEEIFYETN